MRTSYLGRALLFASLASLEVSTVFAQQATSVGTDSVTFQRVQTQGVLRGCSLAYSAFVRDRPYRAAKIVFVVGNITIAAVQDSATVSFKVGLRDIGSEKTQFTQPHFAYLETANATTARSKHVREDLDDGFRLFIFRLDDAITNVLLELIETQRVTVGYNRKAGGLDVLVPLDLTVAKTTYNDDGGVDREHSDEPLKGFAACMVRLVETISAPKQ